MVLKRKRSDSEFSSASSLFSSPPSNNSMDQSYSIQIATPALFSSRTRKRTRDNRPAESDVHQHTLSLLYSAQQKPISNSPPPSAFPSQNPIASMPSSHQPNRQSSLHSFWAIPPRRQSSPSSIVSECSAYNSTTSHLSPQNQASECEDCGTTFCSDDPDAMDMDMMDVDMGGSRACTNCGKQVCHSCAVSNLGAQRRCLNCAGR